METASHFFTVKNDLGEGPRWHPEEKKLYWVDIERGEIHSLEWETQAHEVYRVGFAVGCLGFRRDGGLVLATANGCNFWSEGEGVSAIVDPRTDSAKGWFNDGAVDFRGRFWAGTMTQEGTVNNLYCLKPDGTVERKEQGVAISNGMGWNPAGDTFYFTDSPRKTIYAYDFDGDSGAITNRRVWLHTPDEPGVPDGLAIDIDGCIWSARWDGWRVDRYDPDGNHMLVVKLPCQRPTSCSFAGDDLSTLIITSARKGWKGARWSRNHMPAISTHLRVGLEGSRPHFLQLSAARVIKADLKHAHETAITMMAEWSMHSTRPNFG